MSTPAGALTGVLGELGNATVEAAAFAGGIAVGPILKPALQELENEVWQEAVKLGVVRPLAAATAAAVAAEDVDKYPNMETEAAFTGYDATRFANLWGVTLTAPGVGELLAMLRRSDEVPIDFVHGLRKAKLETQWDTALSNLRDVRIPGPDLAYMVVRGVVPNDGTLPSPLPTNADRLELPPQLAIDTLSEAAKTGWDKERFAALVARSGLAMAPVMAAQANFRGILTDNDYLLTIARGDLFPAYADPVREVSRQILTSGEYAELQLRGYYDRAVRLTHTRKHGMSDADSDLLYDVQGRGVNVHQVLIGERRGGVFKGPISAIPEAFLFALQRGNLRPEVYNLAYAARETFPSAFVLRALAGDKIVSEARTQELFRGLGWPLDLADAAATFYWGRSGTHADPHVTKADNQLWTALHKAYVNDEADAVKAAEGFALIEVKAVAQPLVLARWDFEKSLVRKQLTPPQLKKAYREGIVNPATGTPFTKDEVVAELVTRGFSTADATVFVET